MSGQEPFFRAHAFLNFCVTAETSCGVAGSLLVTSTGLGGIPVKEQTTLL